MTTQAPTPPPHDLDTSSEPIPWRDSLIWLVLFLAKIVLWFALVGYIAHGLARWEMAHYQPSDTPHERFIVVVIDDDGAPSPLFWQAYSEQMLPLATTPHSADCLERCLRQDAQGNWVYYYEGAMWYSESTYRIDDGVAVPLSFLVFTVGHVFYGLIGASIIIMLINYTQRRFAYRHQPDALAGYHRTLAFLLKRCIVWVVVFVLGYFILAWLRA